MKLSITLSYSILFMCYGQLKTENPCGENWVAFHDEKCFKILDDTFRTFAEAEKSCASLENEPTLPIIHTKEEQDFLSDYLFKTQKKVENFWIGAKFSGGKFHWVDDSELSYTNWETDGYQNKENYCVEIEANEKRIGKWIEESCETKKNLVVCQKAQIWSSARLQKAFLETRKKLTDELEEAKRKIVHLERNAVPVGFIYAQLPNEKLPTEIWPGMTWTDVSANYTGVFFRVNGGGATAFGQVQEENAPRLETFLSGFQKDMVSQYSGYERQVSIPKTGWSEAFFTGSYDSEKLIFINFKHSTGEIRPRNMAIRIWRRTA